MKIRTKKLIALWTIGTVMLCGVQIGMAKVIPGVDEPFDPGNYYSPFSISWADSAPSVYALHDLADNGGHVIDHKRLEKSKEYNANFEEILKNAKEMLNLNLLRMLGLDDLLKTNLDSTLKRKFKETNKIATDGIVDDTKLRVGDSWGKAADTEISDQQRYLSNKYLEITKVSEDALESSSKGSKDVAKVLEEMNNAEGTMQFLQAQARLKALKQDAMNNEMAMRAALLNLRAVHDAAEVNRLNKDAEAMSKSMISFPDPYNTKYIEKMRELYGQEKPVHSVFPDFK